MNCETDYLISVTCDTPFLPDNLVEKLLNVVKNLNYDGAYPYTKLNDGKVVQHPTIMLVRTNLKDSLEEYLRNGGRKIRMWTAEEDFCEVFFDNDDCFTNLNTLDELNKG